MAPAAALTQSPWSVLAEDGVRLLLLMLSEWKVARLALLASALAPRSLLTECEFRVCTAVLADLSVVLGGGAPCPAPPLRGLGELVDDPPRPGLMPPYFSRSRLISRKRLRQGEKCSPPSRCAHTRLKTEALRATSRTKAGKALAETTFVSAAGDISGKPGAERTCTL